MRDKEEFEKFRIPDDKGEMIKLRIPGYIGAYRIQTKGRAYLVIASIDNGLREHISISHKNLKIWPTWQELVFIKDIFFKDEEECYQVFPKKSEYVNIRSNCFHIWRDINHG